MTNTTTTTTTDDDSSKSPTTSNTKQPPPSAIEFYDEELSRTIRFIQEAIDEAELSKVDKYLRSANMFLQQIEYEVNKELKKTQGSARRQRRRRLLPIPFFFRRNQQEQDKENIPQQEQQWLDIVEFRKSTLQHLMSERDRVFIYE